MDLLIVVALLGWAVVSFAGRAARRGAQKAGRRQVETGRPGTRPGSSQARPTQTTRPVHVDLPGQTTLPSRWDEGESTMMPMQRRMESAGEGEDPCHEEMLRSAIGPGQLADSYLEPTPMDDTQPVSLPGVHLTFNRDTLVDGVVFSEILGRRPARRAYR